MTYTDFTDEVIRDVTEGRRPLTSEERSFLLSDTPHFEECTKDFAAELPGLSDADLMRAAYDVWADYAAGQV